jgi:hypothetical protein
VRDAVPAGAVFLADGTPTDSASELTEPLVEVARIESPPTRAGEASAAPAHAEPAAAGAEMPPSAPLAIPPTGPAQSGHSG